jgi:hypothetical protein
VTSALNFTTMRTENYSTMNIIVEPKPKSLKHLSLAKTMNWFDKNPEDLSAVPEIVRRPVALGSTKINIELFVL